MDFEPSPKVARKLGVVRRFMSEYVYPNEAAYEEQRAELAAAGRPNDPPPIMLELQQEARGLGLWNLFLPAVSGLSNLEYAPIAEETGRSPFIAPAAMNCLSPDTGNMELLHLFATPEQRRRWLEPLLEGEIRSGYSMTEPDVASSDATNISMRAERDGDHYVLNGRKWWTTGAADPRCKLLIVMAKSDPDAPRHQQHTMLLVPIDTPGVRIVRVLPVYGYVEQQGHCEIEYSDVRVPRSNVLGERGRGFAAAQARLGPGRIHHCMRAIGMAERALELMARRAHSRVAFGGPLARQGVVMERVAEARMAIEQARLLVLKTAWLIDNHGTKAAQIEISAIKVVAPRLAADVIDKAIQLHGGAGFTDDLPLASFWSRARTLRVVDGPDDVHVRTVGRRELARWADAG